MLVSWFFEEELGEVVVQFLTVIFACCCRIESEISTESFGFSTEKPIEPETVFVTLFSLVFVKKRVNPTAGAFQKPTSVSHLLSF